MSNTVRLRHPDTGGLVVATAAQARTIYAGFEPFDTPPDSDKPKARKRKAAK